MVFPHPTSPYKYIPWGISTSSSSSKPVFSSMDVNNDDTNLGIANMDSGFVANLDLEMSGLGTFGGLYLVNFSYKLSTLVNIPL